MAILKIFKELMRDFNDVYGIPRNSFMKCIIFCIEAGNNFLPTWICSENYFCGV